MTDRAPVAPALRDKLRIGRREAPKHLPWIIAAAIIASAVVIWALPHRQQEAQLSGVERTQLVQQARQMARQLDAEIAVQDAYWERRFDPVDAALDRGDVAEYNRLMQKIITDLTACNGPCPEPQ
jgi:hypothetical protein